MIRLRTGPCCFVIWRRNRIEPTKDAWRILRGRWIGRGGGHSKAGCENSIHARKRDPMPAAQILERVGRHLEQAWPTEAAELLVLCQVRLKAQKAAIAAGI